MAEMKELVRSKLINAGFEPDVDMFSFDEVVNLMADFASSTEQQINSGDVAIEELVRAAERAVDARKHFTDDHEDCNCLDCVLKAALAAYKAVKNV